MKQLWANIAHTSGAKVYSLVVGLLTLALTARLLGPEGLGQVAVITTWVSLFSTFAHLSLGQVAMHHMANDPEKNQFGDLLGSLMLLTVVLSLAGWLVATGMYVYNPSGTFKGLPVLVLLVGFLALPFMVWEQYGSSLLMGLDRIRIYNRYQVFGRTISVAAIYALVGGLGLGVTGVLAATLLGQIIVALGGIGFLLAFVRQKGAACKPQKGETLALLAGGAKLHLNAIGAVLITSANVLVLNKYYGAEQAGYFQIATQLLGVLMIIPVSASMVIYGKVARIGPNAAWPENKIILWKIILVMIFLSAIAAILAPWGIVLVAGEKFRPAVEPFQWMLLGLIGMTFSTIMAPQWIGRGYFWQTAGLTFTVGGINLACNIWLIPLYGVYGAVYTFIGTYFISLIVNIGMTLHCEIKSGKER
jgi:antigen flippase